MKKLASILLSLIIAVTFTPALAFADDIEEQAPDAAVEQIEQDAATAEEPAAVEPAEEISEEVIAEEPAPAEVTEEVPAEPELDTAEIATEEEKYADKGFIYSSVIKENQSIVNGATDVWTIDIDSIHAYRVVIQNQGSGALTFRVVNQDGSIADCYRNYVDVCKSTNKQNGSYFVSGGNYVGVFVKTEGVPKINVINDSGSSGKYTLKLDTMSTYNYSLGQYVMDKSGADIIVAALPKLSEDIAVQIHDNTGYFFNASIFDQVSERQVKNKNGFNYSELSYGEVAEIGYANPATSSAYLLIEKKGMDSTIDDDHSDYQEGQGTPAYFDNDYSVAFGVVPANLSKFTAKNLTVKTYNGSYQKQSAPRLAYGNVYVKASDYTLSYANYKNVGAATIKYTAASGSAFTGAKSATYNIRPKGTSISKLTRGKKSFTVKWKKQTAKMSTNRINSYQVQYSTNKNFTSAKHKTITGYKKYTKKVTGLKKKTTYYVRVRTCMKVNGKWYYSAWSAAKAVKTK